MTLIDENLFANITRSPVKEYLESGKLSKKHLGIVLRPDITQGVEFCFHRILKQDFPDPINGVIFPPDFQSLQKINSKEFGEVQEKLLLLANGKAQKNATLANFVNLFTPAIIPQTGITILSQTTAQICKLNDGYVDNNYIEPFIEKGNTLAPIAFLPTEFNSCLDDLQISDVLNIFPEVEQEMLALSIGRALIGADGQKHVHTGYSVNHAYRTFCLIYGFSAGTGKSTLFQFLLEALEETGYTVSHFNSLDDHFGLGDICNNDIAYADDLLTETLSKLLKAPLFKQMITGAKIRAHIKYAPDAEVKSKAVFFANVNDFSPNALYGLDNGTLNRLAILSTLTDFEINAKEGTGLSAGSPNLRTRNHIEWLAKKLEVDKKAIMLKFASICAQMFKKHIDEDTLEDRTKYLKRKLRTQIHEGLEFSTIQLMHFCYMLRKNEALPQLSKGKVLAETFRHLNFIVNDDRSNSVRNKIKELWIKDGRPSGHIWTALKLLDNISINNCDELTPNLGEGVLKDSVKSIKAYWQDLRLASGFNLAGNVAAIKQDWSVSRSSVRQLSSIIEECKKVSHEDVLDPLVKPKVAHLLETSYDREEYIKQLNKTL